MYTSASQSWYLRHVRDLALEVVKEKKPDPDVHHRQTLDVSDFEYGYFKVQAVTDSPTPGVFYSCYNTINMTEAIYVSAPGEESLSDGWWYPYCMIFKYGDRTPAIGMLWEYPQANPQAVKDGGIISHDGLFCSDFYLCDYFAFPEGKVEFC